MPISTSMPAQPEPELEATRHETLMGGQKVCTDNVLAYFLAPETQARGYPSLRLV